MGAARGGGGSPNSRSKGEVTTRTENLKRNTKTKNRPNVSFHKGNGNSVKRGWFYKDRIRRINAIREIEGIVDGQEIEESPAQVFSFALSSPVLSVELSSSILDTSLVTKAAKLDPTALQDEIIPLKKVLKEENKNSKQHSAKVTANISMYLYIHLSYVYLYCTYLYYILISNYIIYIYVIYYIYLCINVFFI